MAKGITILVVGQKHDRLLTDAIESYEKRLRSVMPITWRIIPPSRHTGVEARRAESVSLLRELGSDDYVTLLDESGTQLSSEAFSDIIKRGLIRTTGRTVCIIGGSYGVDDTVRSRADSTISLSRLVFPHQLVRLILVEQLYRAHTIAVRHPYHHQ